MQTIHIEEQITKIKNEKVSGDDILTGTAAVLRKLGMKANKFEIPENSYFNHIFSKNIDRVLKDPKLTDASTMVNKQYKWKSSFISTLETKKNIGENILAVRRALALKSDSKNKPAHQDKNIEKKLEKQGKIRQNQEDETGWIRKIAHNFGKRRIPVVKFLLQVTCFFMVLCDSKKSPLVYALLFWLLCSFLVSDIMILKAVTIYIVLPFVY